MIYLAADHRGFKLKEELKAFLKESEFHCEDVGAFEYEENDDYVDFAKAAVSKISENISENKGIFICGSGHGMDMVANKYKGIRAVLGFNKAVAAQSREHENANVLILASDWLTLANAKEIVRAWLETSFSNEERHNRRLQKIADIEKENFL